MTDEPALHVYVLLDTSASMSGAPLEALKQGLNLLCGTFIARSKRPVQIGLFAYDSKARELAPLADVQAFEMPKLDAGGSSALGEALRLLARTMLTSDPTLVYVFTDGEPTDDWEVAISEVKGRVKQIVAVICGAASSGEALSPPVANVFKVREMTPDLLYESFRAFS
ncbi:MAG TPA: VWA domain-containing protein [Aggregatilineales bacterium]|nr:VWA domain-containing protein [Aggregatilineales bacterium]